MDTFDLFWSAPLEDLKKGYMEQSDAFICLLCGDKIEKGIVYPHEGSFFEAERYMRIHIESIHQSVFAYLIGLDKKLTGITEHQKRLLRLFYQGKSDTEVQTELKIGSASTIRHHRFALKEKQRQARTFLAIMELLEEKDGHAPAFISVHKTAKMLVDRYNVTQEEQQKILKNYFTEGTGSPLINFPSKEKQRLVVLREIAKHLRIGHIYDEQELNQSLSKFYDDYVLIRRYLIDYGLLTRKVDGSQYWLSG